MNSSLSKGVWSFFVAVILICTYSGAGFCQAGGGSIQGTVTDSTGAVIPDAQVSAKNVATGLVTSQKSTGAGLYSIGPLQVGEYTVTCNAPGFGARTQQHVQLNGLQVLTLNLQLSVAGTDVVIDVVPSDLNGANPTVGDTVASQDYQLLPLVMNAAPRDPTAFVTLANGVDSSHGYNGGESHDNETYIDGVVASQINAQGAPQNTSLSAIVEAVDESEVQTIGISAKYQGQGFNNFTMKSGTNDWHGTAFEFFRNTELDTWNYLSKSVINPATGKASKPVEKQNEYGFVLGGPLRKNKAFFFIGYERMAYRSLPNPTYFTLPTNAMRGLDPSGNPMAFADFSGYAAATGYHIFDLASTTCINGGANCRRDQFPGDRIPRSRFSQVSLNAQQFLPTNLVSQNLYQNNYLSSLGTGFNYFKASGKGDYQFTPNQRMSVVYLVGERADAAGTMDSGQVLPLPYAATEITTLFDNTAIIDYNWALTPHLVNDFKYSFIRNETIQTDPTMLPQYSAVTLGMQNVPPGWAAGSFLKAAFLGNYAPQDFDGVGSTQNQNRPQILEVNTYGATDDIVWTRGKHNVSAGVQYEWYQFNSALPTTGTTLNFKFDNTTSAMFSGQDAAGATTPGSSAVTTTSGNAYAGYLQGATTVAYNANQSAYGVLGGRFQAVSPYVQDDWKATENLTLNIGLRWDVYEPYHEVQNRMSFFNPDLPNPVAIGAMGAIEYDGYKNQYYCQCHTRVKTYLGNLGPRLGFAYASSSKSILRGSFGISATHSGGTGGYGGAREGTNQTGLGAVSNMSQVLGYESPFNWSNPLPTPPPPSYDNTYGVGFVSSGAGSAGAGSVAQYDEPYYASRAAYYENFSLGLQYAVTSRTTVSADYSGSLGRFLPAASGDGRNSNQILPQYLGLGNLLTTPLLNHTAALNTALQQLGLPAFTLPFSNFNQAAPIGQALRPFAEFGGIGTNFQDYGKSSYNALELALKQRAFHGLSLTVNYTYSKLMDDIANRPSAYVTANGYNLDSGPNALHIYGSWLTPALASGHRLVREVTAGWVISGIYSFKSGNPLSYTTTCNANFAYFGACRPTLNPNFSGSLRTNVPYGSKTFTQAAFVPSTSTSPNAPFITSATAFGNAPVANAYGVTGPSTKDADASIRRTFGPFERARLTIGADVFNLTNHVEANGLNTTITSSAFGTASKQSNSSRDVQLNAKIEF